MLAHSGECPREIRCATPSESSRAAAEFSIIKHWVVGYFEVSPLFQQKPKSQRGRCDPPKEEDWHHHSENHCHCDRTKQAPSPCDRETSPAENNRYSKPQHANG
jgi:hypothetical protein